MTDRLDTDAARRTISALTGWVTGDILRELRGLADEIDRLRAVLAHDGRCPAYYLPLNDVPSFPVRCDRLPGHAQAHGCGVHHWPNDAAVSPKDGEHGSEPHDKHLTYGGPFVVNDGTFWSRLAVSPKDGDQ